MPNPPSFLPVAKSSPSMESVEKLFYSLSARPKSHAYLRGPQQDVLREFDQKHVNTPDLALELPTGTGKTTVGLLIAEWKRRKGEKVAFLCLHNQLASRVLDEGRRLGIPCADLRGGKAQRDPLEEGRYRTARAIAVTSYSNLFNVAPVIRDPTLLIFDDAHGGEQQVSGMWTVVISRRESSALYYEVLQALQPAISPVALTAITDRNAPADLVEMADVHHHPECVINLQAAMAGSPNHPSHFAWSLIKNNLSACLFMATSQEIVIRPLIPPTFSHAPFHAASQRIYMSATLGSEGDLFRAYGRTKVELLGSKSAEWGRRYIFIPGLYCKADEAVRLVGAIWAELTPRRSVLLCPSDADATACSNDLETVMSPKPLRFTSKDISDSLAPFTNSQDGLLVLAGRYDGLDLPDDQCRLLVMFGSPGAINSLERYLANTWKIAPLFGRRERTRIVQGVGRCTRNAADFAIIVWLGQGLIDASTSQRMSSGLPPELAAELQWGVQQSELAGNQPDSFTAMLLALTTDSAYRGQANEAIHSIQDSQVTSAPEAYEDNGAEEVRFSNAMWSGNFDAAAQIARRSADTINSPELSGYRGWWWYLLSTAAFQLGDHAVEADAIKRAVATGVNTGWLSRIARRQQADVAPSPGLEPGAENLWDAITKWGWAGPAFEQAMANMVKDLSDIKHTQYHQGLEALGRCFGAFTERPTAQGAPDVIWLLRERALAFEAKTGKKAGGTIFKKDLQEAKGHSDWINFYRKQQGYDSLDVQVVIVSPTAEVHEIAAPFTETLFYVEPQSVSQLAQNVVSAVRMLRTKFAGQEFAAATQPFSAAMRANKLTWKDATESFLTQKL